MRSRLCAIYVVARKIDILRKLKQRFGGKIIRDARFQVG
jgi:hypothetical protein